MWSYLGAAILAITTSLGWRWYIKSTNEDRPWASAGSDFIILMSGSLLAQLWAIDHNDFGVLFTYDSIAVLTTLIAGLLSRRKRKVYALHQADQGHRDSESHQMGPYRRG